MKLNLGCGDNIKKGYINIDMNFNKNINLVADVKRLPFKTNSITEIFAQDIYEHIPHEESQTLLNHWADILKPKGLLYLQLPSLDCVTLKYNELKTVEELEWIIQRIFGCHKFDANNHRTIGHPTLLKHYLMKAGITKITIESCDFGSTLNMRIWAFK